MIKLKAMKLNEYVVEPAKEEPGIYWEGHHTTNPTVIRLTCDKRVFLGYRAGGFDDRYCLGTKMIWGSSLGLAILDERGDRVLNRLPLPVMKIKRDIKLPLNEEEYIQYMKKHKDTIVVLHDFRFYEYEENIYVIYHDGSLSNAYDCVKRMTVERFLQKINRSVKLAKEPVYMIWEEWEKLWWEDDVWEPCGAKGSRLIYPSANNKNDIVFFVKPDGMLQMCHRPLPDIAVLDTGSVLHAEATKDGLTTYGVLESCIRPGFFDNSHIGNNGMPTRARIGELDVWIDVIHGVHNRLISDENADKNLFTYLPYLRIKDYKTGELLYYSQDPILDADNIWKEYVEEGTWVSQLPYHDAIMFAGGQIEVEPGKNGLDDLFAVYMGVGDTAVAKAVFKLRELLPACVISDLSVLKSHKAYDLSVTGYEQIIYEFPEELCGWKWNIQNDISRRCITIIRQLSTPGGTETAKRPIYTVPGGFDPDLIAFDGKSVRYIEGIGWVLVYAGAKWQEENGRKTSLTSYGIIILDRENPERVLYRSTEPVSGIIEECEGWKISGSSVKASMLLDEVKMHIPERVIFEIKRMYELIDAGKCWRSHMTAWLKNKAKCK